MGSCSSNQAVAPEEEKKQKVTPSILRTEDINTVYEMKDELGRGGFGIVVRGIRQSPVPDFWNYPKNEFAIKSVSKFRSTQEDESAIMDEISVMERVAGDTSIVQLYETYQDTSNIHLVMELCTGGELFDSIVARGSYCEKDAAGLLRMIVSSVQHIHSRNVCHRDLKPENFLFFDDTPESILKVTDFGLSAVCEEGQTLHAQTGTLFYIAPEVLSRRPYDRSCDLWSVGILMHVIITGELPFFDDQEDVMAYKIQHTELDYDAGLLGECSDSAKALLRKLLVKDPSLRLSAAEALADPWVTGEEASDRQISRDVIESLKNFNATTKFKRKTMNMLAANLPNSKTADLQRAFREMDVDKSGTISLAELSMALESIGFAQQAQQLKTIMAQVDYNGNGRIDYNEFVAATMQMQMNTFEDELYKTFRGMDADGNGYLDREELAKLAGGDEQALLSLEEVEEVLKELDVSGDGRIEYNEFMKVVAAKNKNAIGGSKQSRKDNLRRVFDQYDLDKSGDMTRDELGRFAKILHPGYTDAQIQVLFAKMDNMVGGDNTDQKIQFAEFEAYMLSLTAGTTDEEFSEAMSQLDHLRADHTASG